MENKIKSLISLSNKAKLLAKGEMQCVDHIRSKKAKLLIIAEDASDNTKKKLSQKATFYHIPFVYLLEKKELARISGNKGGENSCVVILNEGFAKSCAKLLNESKR